MTAVLFVINAVVAITLVLLILLQRSEAATGGAFGGTGGGGQPVVRNPLAKPTAILAGIFLFTSLLIAYLQHGSGHSESIMADEGTVTLPEEPIMPVAPDLPAPTLETSTEREAAPVAPEAPTPR